MDAIKAKAISEGTKTNDYQIFREVVGEPSHGCILSMGIGIKAKDLYGLTSSGKGCSKRCREDFTKEKEDLEACLRQEMDSKLAKFVEKLDEKFAQKLQSMGIPQQYDIDPATLVHSQTYAFTSWIFYSFLLACCGLQLASIIMLYYFSFSTVLIAVYRFCI